MTATGDGDNNSNNDSNNNSNDNSNNGDKREPTIDDERYR